MLDSTVTLTTNEAAAAGAIFGGLFGVAAVIGIAFVILMIVALWKIFKKAGEPGWKSLIPIYNAYILFKICGMKAWFWIYLLITIGTSIFTGAMTAAGQATMVDGQITSDNPAFAVVALCAGIYEVVMGIVLCYRLAKVFGRGIGTTIGLIFLPNIFTLILAFGSAKYNKKALKK